MYVRLDINLGGASEKPRVWLHGEVRTPPLSAAARVGIDSDAIVILDVFAKKTPKTPQSVVDACHRRLKQYDEL